MLNNKVVLITGGTGFFGQAMAETLLNKYKLKKIIIFSRDENKQYLMKNKFSKKKHNVLKFFLGDVRDESRLTQAFEGVDFVIHAAALKHVPATEYDPLECVKTNIYGAQNIISAALKNSVQKVIAISTDKAVNPINIYGASKLAADKLFLSANNIKGSKKISFSVVRYGNVWSSRGSVVPFFLNIVKNKGPFIPLTDDRMTRFIISINEGISFVINSLNIMRGGEIFVPKILSVKILDLANAIRGKIPIKITGIRPGEKLHEVLCGVESSHLTIEYKNFFIIIPDTNFFRSKESFLKYAKEKGKFVNANFSYNSLNNNFLVKNNNIKSIIQNFS